MTVTKRSLEGDIYTGDVVTLRDGSELMTVEAVHQNTFGIVLDCIWFDGDDALRFSRFPVNAVAFFPRKVVYPSFKVGMEVRLRSRGPVMTIRRLIERTGEEWAECAWTGVSGRERKRAFSLDCLVLTMLERFEDEDGLTF